MTDRMYIGKKKISLYLICFSAGDDFPPCRCESAPLGWDQAYTPD